MRSGTFLSRILLQLLISAHNRERVTDGITRLSTFGDYEMSWR